MNESVVGREMLTKYVITLDRLFGFLLGTVLAGGGLYYYVVDEYKVSNELLTEDIYVCIIHSMCGGEDKRARWGIKGHFC